MQTLSRGSKGGFTLLELLLTLAILAIAAGLVGPALVRMVENQRLESASRQVSAALRQARDQAIRQQRILIVRFEKDQKRLSLLDSDGTARGQIQLPTGVRLREVRHPGAHEETSQAFRQGPWTLLFTPSGTAEDAEIFLENERGRTMRIRADSFTGLARVERVASEAKAK